MLVKVKKLHKDAKLPVYATEGAGCFDIAALEDVVVGVVGGIIPTGLSFEIPEGYVMLLYSRSGHGFVHDIRLANCVGVIDSDYRGEVKIKLTNDNKLGKPFYVSKGERIAQGMIVPYEKAKFFEVDDLESTARGDGGFGSTG